MTPALAIEHLICVLRGAFFVFFLFVAVLSFVPSQSLLCFRLSLCLSLSRRLDFLNFSPLVWRRGGAFLGGLHADGVAVMLVAQGHKSLRKT